MSAHPRLDSPIKINGLSLRNRIVMPPMGNNLATPRGTVTEELIRHYEIRAKSLGLLIVQHTYVAENGKLSKRQLGLSNDNQTDGLKKFVARMHALRTPIAIQLNHAGRLTSSQITGEPPVAPSPIPEIHLSYSHHEKPVQLTIEKLEEIIESFALAAQRAVKAGFDAIEIHGAHGFLLNQFVSPLSNTRTDEYGGRLENRIQFPLDVITRIKEVIGDFPLLYRLGADDMLPGGFNLVESKIFAEKLVDAGIHLIDVSGGMVGSIPPNITGQGYFVPLAEAIKRVVSVPVIGVGGINTPEFADLLIKTERVDLVAIGRAILENPEWAQEALDMLKNS